MGTGARDGEGVTLALAVRLAVADGEPVGEVLALRDAEPVAEDDELRLDDDIHYPCRPGRHVQRAVDGSGHAEH